MDGVRLHAVCRGAAQTVTKVGASPVRAVKGSQILVSVVRLRPRQPDAQALDLWRIKGFLIGPNPYLA